MYKIIETIADAPKRSHDRTDYITISRSGALSFSVTLSNLLTQKGRAVDFVIVQNDSGDRLYAAVPNQKGEFHLTVEGRLRLRVQNQVLAKKIATHYHCDFIFHSDDFKSLRFDVELTAEGMIVILQPKKY